jgi:hypothetical protein
MDVDEITDDLLRFIEENSADLVRTAFSPGQVGFQYLAVLPNPERTMILVEKNIKVFGGINQYVEDFVPKVLAGLAAMPAGPKKEETKAGHRLVVEELLAREGLTEENKQRLEDSLQREFAAAPAAGGFKMPRKYSRKYCKKTTCKKMGFTQRASCRPYKKCSTRKTRGRRR